MGLGANDEDDDNDLDQTSSDLNTPVAKKLQGAPAMQKWQALASNPQYQIGTPPDTRQTLQQAISKASDLYNTEAGTNDWAEVGQMLGRAAAQYAGAQAGMGREGKYGNNMAALNQGPGIDYQAKNDQAFRKYQQTVRNAQDLNASGRENFNEGELAKQRSYERQAEPLKVQATGERESGLEASRERIANMRDQQRTDKENRIQQQHVNDLNIKDTDMQQKVTEDRLAKASSLLNNSEVIDDLGSKDASKLESKYGALAGSAGIDLNVVKQQAESAPEVDKSVLGIKYKGKDPDAYKKALSGEIQKIRDQVDALKAHKAQLLRGGGTSTASSSTESPPSQQSPDSTNPEGSDMVSVKGPSGQTALIKKAAWDSKYSKMQGYSLVQ